MTYYDYTPYIHICSYIFQVFDSWTTAFRWPWRFVGVGWGGACINVHVNLHMKYCRCYAVAVGWGMYSWLRGRVGWSRIITSLALSHIRHATLLYVLLDFHSYFMLHQCTFSWTSIHTSCYASVRFLGLPCVRHAALLYVLLNFHAYVMLRYCTFS